MAVKPAVHTPPIWWHLVDVTAISQLKQGFNILRVGKKLLGVPVRALNLKDGEVAHSAFFENNEIAELSPEDVRWGPSRPDDSGMPSFVITKPKVEGKTPGFFVTDAKGARYLFKLDPPDAPELLTGAEVVASKLLHALGYRVPSYEIIFVKPNELRLGPDVKVKAASGKLQPFTQGELDRFLHPRIRQGRVRVVASKILEGQILGPASFKRFRDCADIRALKVVYAWLNNIDAKDHNTLLVWDGTETLGYLIDFGTSLGADAGLAGPKNPCAGWTNIFDPKEFLLSLMTLGLHSSGCDQTERAFSPSIGLFTARIDAERWKPYAPNLAFEEMNDDDARWISRRMIRLSRLHLEAAVEAGQYSDPKDAGYLVDILDKRRRIIIRHYLDDELEEIRQL